MMTRWTHQTECARTFERCVGRIDRCPSGSRGVLVNIAMCWCIRIEIICRIFNPRKMLRRLRAQQFDFIGRDRIAPLPGRMSIFQQRCGARNSCRAFRMPGAGIFQAMRIVKDNHRVEKLLNPPRDSTPRSPITFVSSHPDCSIVR